MTFLGSARRFSVSYYLHILKNRRQGQLSKILYFSGRNLKITKVDMKNSGMVCFTLILFIFMFSKNVTNFVYTNAYSDGIISPLMHVS